MHTHHTCPCKHHNIRYCADCKLVHCLGCGKEWRDGLSWAFNTGTPRYGDWCQTYDVQTAPQFGTTTCKHKG